MITTGIPKRSSEASAHPTVSDPDIVGGRNPVRATQILGETFRALELGSSRARSEDGEPGVAKRIGDTPATSGASGPTTTRWIGAGLCELDDCRSIAWVDRHAFGPSRDARDFPARRSAGRSSAIALAAMRAHLRVRPTPKAECPWISLTIRAARLLANVAPGDNSPPLSVSELSGALKRTIENAFGQVRVRGEISGFKRHASGHCYFTLKDDSACIDAVIWRGSAQSLAFRPEDGAEVIATGKLTTYPGRSKYQIVVDRMELAGEGALLALLERRRKALAAEGLFDASSQAEAPVPAASHRRRYLADRRGDPRHPSSLGGSLPDPCDPVAGRGPGRRRGGADRRGHSRFPDRSSPRPDLLIVARGGGSIEDLWAFNEEEVVRAAAEFANPADFRRGHETDTTLIDFASDLRAPTPTAAAEIAVPGSCRTVRPA